MDHQPSVRHANPPECSTKHRVNNAGQVTQVWINKPAGEVVIDDPSSSKKRSVARRQGSKTSVASAPFPRRSGSKTSSIGNMSATSAPFGFQGGIAQASAQLAAELTAGEPLPDRQPQVSGQISRSGSKTKFKPSRTSSKTAPKRSNSVSQARINYNLSPDAKRGRAKGAMQFAANHEFQGEALGKDNDGAFVHPDKLKQHARGNFAGAGGMVPVEGNLRNLKNMGDDHGYEYFDSTNFALWRYIGYSCGVCFTD